MIFPIWNQWTSSSWFQCPLVSVDRNQVSLPSWEDKTTFVSRNNCVVITGRPVNGLIVLWVSEFSPLSKENKLSEQKPLVQHSIQTQLGNAFVYSDYFSLWIRPRVIEENKNNNQGWQQFFYKCIYFILSGEREIQIGKSVAKNAEGLTRSQFQPIQRYVLLFYSQRQTHRSNVNWW